jgi:hypothetical protein
MSEQTLELRHTSAIHYIMAGESVSEVVDTDFSNLSKLAHMTMNVSHGLVIMSAAVSFMDQWGAWI